MTINGIAADAISKGHKLAKSQTGDKTIARNKTSGNAIEAMMEAKETYRKNRTTNTHIARATRAQIV